MPSPAFTIDSVLMTNQPSFCGMDPAEAEVDEMADGTKLASKRTYGAVIRATWGKDAMRIAAMAELRTARNSLVEHTVAFTDATGTTHTKNVLWLSDPKFRMMPGMNYESVTIEFPERG